eukprot:9949741-Karenia_brevis.AAC.1
MLTNITRGYGSPLSRSTKGPFAKDPASCAHPMSKLVARGGRNETFWWTCLNWGSRWTRVAMNTSARG